MNGNPKTDLVSAKIIFTGVMMACINQKQQYEVGMVQCPRHKPTITVKRNEGGTVSSETVEWPAGHDLLFKVINPNEVGVSKYPTADPDLTFNRVIDLEGPDFYNQPVNVNTSALQGRRLAVTAGLLYTDTLTPVDFTLVTWTQPNDPGKEVKVIGKIAEDVGLNIVCTNKADSGIQIIDLTTKEVINSLPTLDGTSYQIVIDNDCREAGGSPLPVGTDLRYLYTQNLVSSASGVKYDLKLPATEAPLPSPDACENSFLSRTTTLGIKS